MSDDYRATVADLIKALQGIDPTLQVSRNRIGNIALLRDGTYVGYVSMPDHEWVPHIKITVDLDWDGAL